MARISVAQISAARILAARMALAQASLARALALALAIVGAGQAALAGGPGLDARQRARSGGLMNYQLDLLDNREASRLSGTVSIAPPRAVVPGTPEAQAQADTGAPEGDGQADSRYVALARSAARRHAIPEELFLRLVARESRWNPRARSARGALGLAQLMPETAARLGVDPLDPEASLFAGARYLRAQFDRFGNWRLALAAYNAGPEAVEKYRGVPPFAETRAYVEAILSQR